jgi:drug/metabolite transporter (DMT)-like permease
MSPVQPQHPPAPAPAPIDAATRLGGQHTRRGQLRAIACVAGATFCFTVAGAFIKAVSGEFHVAQITFFRSIFALVPLLPAIIRQGARIARVVDWRWHAARCGFGFWGMMAAFYGLAFLSLADFTALGFAMPLFLTILSIPLLGEKVGIRRASAIVVGFLGVLLIVRPFGGADEMPLVPTLIVLSGTVGWALSMIAIRRLGALGENNLTIVFWFAVVGAVAAGLLMIPVWVTPTWAQFGFLTGAGLVSGFAQIMMTEAYRQGETTVVAPFEYVAIFWAVLLGWTVFDEAPAIEMLAGVVVLVASGLYILHREVVRRREREAGQSP